MMIKCRITNPPGIIRSDLEMKQKDRLKGKTVFFSHPCFTFKTETEERCISIFKDLKIKRVINPADYGLKHDMRMLIKEADIVIGMSVSEKLTFLVWNEMGYGKKLGLDLYTIMVESKHDIGPIVIGIPDNIEKMSLEDTKVFTSEILETHRPSIGSLLVGKWSKGDRF